MRSAQHPEAQQSEGQQSEGRHRDAQDPEARHNGAHPRGRGHTHAMRQVAGDYAHGHDIDPQSYAPFITAYLGAVGAYAWAFRRSGRALPESVSGRDVALLGTATFKLSRLVSRARVTSFLRFPFTRYRGDAPGPEIDEEPRGQGVRHHIGELLVCPFCTSQWAGTMLMGLYLANPPAGRAVASLLSAIALSDGLQYAETALHEAVEH